jgi:uncharacterized RDD family membrane protein YckC
MTVAPFPGATLRAGVITRLAAVAIDVIILFACLRGTVWFIQVTDRVLRRFAPPVDVGTVIVAIAPLIVGAYHVLFWRFGGQTPGKWLLGVKVVAQGGGRVSLLRALVRLVGYLLSALPLYLGFLWILGPRRRGWHDVLAGTEVVYVSRRGPPESRPLLSLGAVSRALPSGAAS